MNSNGSSSDYKMPLEGIRVVEFGSLLAGPFSTRFFADFGAEVIKVEAPDAPDPMRDWGPAKYKGRALVWPVQSRNKKVVTINMRKPEGQELARRLIDKADMVVENFRPGTLERWGCGYEELSKRNPGLILIHVSGYGQTGRYRNRAGFGSASGAMGGLRFLTGYPDRPPTRVGLSLEDSLGSWQAVIGGLLALRARDLNGGKGQEVDVSITEAVFAMTEGAIPEYALTGYIRQRQGSTLPGVAPSNIYEAKDGIWMVIAANADNPFKRLFELMGMPEVANNPKYMSHEGRWEDRDQLDEWIGAWAKQHTSEEITKLLEEAGVPSAPIYSAKEIYEDPYFWERESIIEVEDPDLGKIPMPGVMPKLRGTPGKVKWTGPGKPGMHNDEVFRNVVGLTDEELADYKARGII
ncbi:MAG: succinyl-CoA--D-citramalate CoA-transferase [Dehalococcoidia bacterium]|nr:MAG: succinyl-CoA--D-citramalate CoA-transferase [Dehalococcoidia bacterium]